MFRCSSSFQKSCYGVLLKLLLFRSEAMKLFLSAGKMSVAIFFLSAYPHFSFLEEYPRRLRIEYILLLLLLDFFVVVSYVCSDVYDS
jgi:hypothetical protein